MECWEEKKWVLKIFTIVNGLAMVCWMTISTLNNCAMVCWSLLKNDVDERGDESTQLVDCSAQRVVDRARDAHAPDRREWTWARRGEIRGGWILWNMWRLFVGWLNLSHLNYLNSIISLQMIFLKKIFLPKFMIFFYK